MKTLLLTFECPPDVTGGGLCTYVQEYINAKIERREPTIVLTADFSVKNEVCSYFGCVKIIRFNPSNGASFKFMGHWAAMSYEFSNQVKKIILEGFDPDWIEICDGFGLGYFTLQRKLCLEAPFKDQKILITAHTPITMIDEWDKKNIYKLPTYFTKYMEQFCFQAADKVISPSDFLKQKLLAEFLEQDVEIDVIPNPYQISSTHSVKIDHPADDAHIYSFPDYAIVSRVCHWKGIECALAGFDLYWRNGGLSSLSIYGSDTIYAVTNQSFTELLISKYGQWIERGLLRFEGLKTHSEILVLKKNLKALFHPSLFENYPYSVIEHMAEGGLVAASQNGGQAEFICHGQNGFLFDPHSAKSIQDVIFKIDALDKGQRLSIAKHAIETIQKTCSYANVMAQKAEALTTRKHPTSAPYFPFTSGTALPHPTPKNNSDLTVIIPHYNQATQLEKTLESIKRSTLSNIRILIVDDGSTEKESIIILKELEARYTTVTVLYKKHSGPAEARNFGIHHATTDYVAFLNADDRVNATYYETALRILNHYNNVGFVGAWYEHSNQNGDLDIWPTFNPEVPLQISMNTQNSQGLVMRRKAYLAYGQQDPNVSPLLNGWESTISMVTHGVRGVMIPHPLLRCEASKNLTPGIQSTILNIEYNYILKKHHAQISGFYAEIISFLNSNGPNTRCHNPTFPPD